jgi:hypothetical protein
MVGSLSIASTAVSSAKVAVVDSSEVGRSAVYRRYNNGTRTGMTFGGNSMSSAYNYKIYT